ncbi:MAG: acyltransferase, partial [Mesorhizobium sp.]
GWVGVQVFFVISGFVIAFSAENSTPLKFFEARVRRLAPAVWVCAPVSAIVLLLVGLLLFSSDLLARDFLGSRLF